ncbi:hypothetical protein Cpin_4083 [Chitinophaga pinensis DSM 2588]|uniref:Uncharacterized protein n=1 Tax=Chitinophaga pinensis (strain ATCC 43595 / DSM 2588 / LMG 13176 / NBRC 15968 / NCIMB 11800 / UQM 2034) TaxID=485918 RepID=A0A979G6F4_CHIPD|nr:hypothetical protein Cpin_4083 [Chitinophaga pinensis DSM 2588]
MGVSLLTSELRFFKKIQFDEQGVKYATYLYVHTQFEAILLFS